MTNPLIDNGTDVRNIYHQYPISLDGEFSKAVGWEKGLTAVETGEENADGIAKGDWAKVELGAEGAGLDMLCVATDPIGYFSGQLASWMMEHLEPLGRVLHQLITVRDDLIAALAGELADLGLATPAVVTQAMEEIARMTSQVGMILTKLDEAIHRLEWLLAAPRNMLDGGYGELSALTESTHAEVAS